MHERVFEHCLLSVLCSQVMALRECRTWNPTTRDVNRTNCLATLARRPLPLEAPTPRKARTRRGHGQSTGGAHTEPASIQGKRGTVSQVKSGASGLRGELGETRRRPLPRLTQCTRTPVLPA
jgi:hypothetical protein